MRSATAANVYNALLGLLVILVSWLGFPLSIKIIIFNVLGLLIIIFALASSNFGQHGSGPGEAESH